MFLSNWFRSVRNRQNHRASLHLEPLEDRTTPSTVQGVVFDDANGDGIKQAGEAGLAGWTVFLDTDRDTVLDAGEVSTVTGVNGDYVLSSGVAPPRVDVCLILQTDDPNQAPGRWLRTTSGSVKVPIPDNTTTGVADFGVQYHVYGPIVPVGGETLANVTTTGAQGIADTVGQDVAADAQGNFVVVWRSDAGGGTYNVVARLFNADGTARSGEIVVASAVAVPADPTVAMADNGMFALAWSVRNSSTQTNVVYTRAYAANGTPLTASPVQVTPSGTKVSNGVCDIAMDADGDFVVLYQGGKKSGQSWNYGITGFQRYNELGQAVGNNTQVVDAALNNGQSSIAMDNAGNFVVVWDDSGVRAQRYTSAGTKTGSQIVVSNGGGQSSVAMNGSGQFTVAWYDSGLVGNVAQVYSATGTPVGGAVQISSTNTFSPAGVAMDDAGNVVFTWMETYGDTATTNNSFEVYFRRLTASAVLEPEYVANTTEGFQMHPSIAFTGADSFVISWSGYGVGDDEGVFFQRFGPA